MKKIMLWMMSAVILFSLAACGKSSSTQQIANPFTEYDSMEEAKKAAGFPLSVPDRMDGFSDRVIRTMTSNGTSMIEVIYQNGDDADENEIRIRKANGTEEISGDYNDYSEISTLTVNDIPVSVKGENGSIILATWTSGGYSYSAGFYDGTGISPEDLENLVSSIQ